MEAKKINVNGIDVDLVMEPENGSVTTSKIADKAVTKAKLSDGLVAEIDKMRAITYAELKTLRDGGNLQPGHWYRLTDYQCVTTQAGTQAVNHPFDILIRADSPSVLNENCYAALHEGDTYFSAEHLQSWRLKYTIDNNRYCWGGYVHGKMLYALTLGVYLPRAEAADQPVTYGKAWAVPQEYVQQLGIQYFYTKDETLFDWSDYLSFIPTDTIITDYAYSVRDLGGAVVLNACEAEGKGVIYEMTDEYGNKLGFDFKNIQILAKVGADGHYDAEGTDTYVYTFNIATPMGMMDLSNDLQGFHAKSTVVTPCGMIGRNVWLTSLADAPGIIIQGNSFGPMCYGNIFGASYHDNIFGESCYGNTFKGISSGNTFGVRCYNNTFGANCDSNTFGGSCYGNTFVSSCSGNNFGAICHNNTFGAICNNNTFEINCFSNNFGDTFALHYSRFAAGFNSNTISWSVGGSLSALEVGAISNNTIEISKPITWGQTWLVMQNSNGQIKQGYFGDLIQ